MGSKNGTWDENQENEQSASLRESRTNKSKKPRSPLGKSKSIERILDQVKASESNAAKGDQHRNRETVVSRLFGKMEASCEKPLPKSSENLTHLPSDGRNKQVTSKLATHTMMDIMESVKFSNSEPNLTKTHSFKSGSTGASSLLRQSISFSDSKNDDLE